MTRTLRRIATTGAGITAVALATTLAVPAADAATTAAKAGVTTDTVQAAAGWLVTQFENTSHLPAPNGYKFSDSYGTPPTYYVDYGENADVVFGLAAAKAGSAKSAVAMKYLAGTIGDYADLSGANGGPYDGSLGKAAVAAEVTGDSPTSFGGHNLLALLKSDECAAGSTTCTPGEADNIFSSISESFVLIAEARAGGTYAPSTAAQAYFASLQCASGGFTGDVSACKTQTGPGAGLADIDATSYAIMAMTAMGTTGTEFTQAISWLQGQQNADGYWTTQDIPNADSTGLAASALQGAGATYGKARSWLLSQQQGPGTAAAGALQYGGTVAASTTAATSPSVLATAQGLDGLVDGSTLATLTATGSTSGTSVYRAVAKTTYRQQHGKSYVVRGLGFAAGEKARVALGKTVVATTTVGPLGGVYAPVKAVAAKGYASYTVTGLSSALTATHRVHITA